MPDDRILLIIGIPSWAFQGDYLYKMFGEYGAIQQIRIGSNKITKGCVIVVYEICDSAAAAMRALDGYQIEGKTLRVAVYDEVADKKALERRKRRREVQSEYNKHIADTAKAPEEDSVVP